MKSTPVKLVNWRQILEQLDRAGVCCSEVSRRLEINRSTIQYWLNGGGEPRYSDGQRLLELHKNVMDHHAVCEESQIASNSA